LTKLLPKTGGLVFLEHGVYAASAAKHNKRTCVNLSHMLCCSLTTDTDVSPDTAAYCSG